ncbi:PREDICTED: SPX domain-containing protein 1-like [Ipomoea nil]|uniref:SPX domain-containing protein 1-like n=1 Tax=Ipomoea nil TaxID=35883 RepID=UPI0009008869|nr:PREDICTED: SPX domain-containing protein 1-like [Ipomoea nil]
MKFGKSLSIQIEETLPEWRDKFLSYKELKKRLKLIEPKGSSASAGDGGEARPNKRPKLAVAGGSAAANGGGDKEAMTEAEVEFVKLLEDELEKFNTFFVEKEEEYIIRLKDLQDRVAKANDYNDEIIKIRKEVVDFHGEMVLLENYSALNYTGLAKILKKYDKRTGTLLRLPFIQKVLQQPFFTTDLLYKLVKECEILIDRLFPVIEAPSSTEAGDGNEPSTSGTAKSEGGLLRGPKELAEIEYMESLHMKSTLSALRVLKEIRSRSSTVSVFSLPPLQTSGVDDTWNKIPILEQAAK